MRVNNINDLVFGVVEHAVNDVKSLREAGAIVGKKPVHPWPMHRGRPKKFLGHYDKTHKVDELIHFFTSGAAAEFLESIGSCIDPERMNEELGLA